ncbi:hypothetical protein ACQ10C_15275, partial [Enterococcus faecalis]|uniref:hypothetical protein n=1 Tax=Enterococcus faecalis TaxID=1351 RepID=UPI003D6A57EE
TTIMTTYFAANSSISIEERANVVLQHTAPSGDGGLLIPYCDTFDIKKNANLTIKATSSLSGGLIGQIKAGMPLNIESGASLNLESTNAGTRG